MAYTYTPQHNTKEPATTTTTRDDAMTTEQQPSVLFHALAVSKTTSIEECVSTNYGSWRALLNAMKEMQRNEDSRFSRVNVERRANLSVSFHQWGTRQLKERSPMFADEFEKFVNCKEIVESLMEDFGTKSGGRINENEQKTIRTPDASSAPPIVPRKQPKAVMIEIPIDGKCETEREEKEDPFKVSGRVVNTPPSTRGHEQQQQQQQHNEEEEEEEEEEERRLTAPQHTRFDSSPESEGGIFEEEKEAAEEEEEILLETPAAPRPRRDGSMPPPLEAVTVMKQPKEPYVALTPKQVYESAERLKKLASEKLQNVRQRYEEDGKEEQDEEMTMEETHAAHQKQVMSYLEGFEAILEKIKGQVAKIKNAPLSLAMAETISVELEIDHSIKEIRAEIQAQNK